MPLPKLTFLALVAIAGLGSVAVLADDPITVDPKIATMTVDQKVEARQQAMKEDGRQLSQASKAKGDAAVKIATTVVQNMTNFPALFADGATNGKSHALPIIWTEFDRFTAIFDKGRGLANDMLVAARAGDEAKYLASLKGLAAVCGECHQTYRGRD